MNKRQSSNQGVTVPRWPNIISVRGVNPTIRFIYTRTVHTQTDTHTHKCDVSQQKHTTCHFHTLYGILADASNTDMYATIYMDSDFAAFIPLSEIILRYQEIATPWQQQVCH